MSFNPKTFNFNTLFLWLKTHSDWVLLATSAVTFLSMIIYLMTPQPVVRLSFERLPNPSLERVVSAEAISSESFSDISQLASKKPAHARKVKKPKPVLKLHSIHINQASVSQLDALPGVGPKLAQRIVDYRKKSGPFATLEDLQNVRGIGPKNFAKMQAYLTI